MNCCFRIFWARMGTWSTNPSRKQLSVRFSPRRFQSCPYGKRKSCVCASGWAVVGKDAEAGCGYDGHQPELHFAARKAHPDAASKGYGAAGMTKKTAHEFVCMMRALKFCGLRKSADGLTCILSSEQAFQYGMSVFGIVLNSKTGNDINEIKICAERVVPCPIRRKEIGSDC